MRLPYNKEQQVERLRSEVAAHGSLFVAFDFDNTIFDYHNQGFDYSGVITLLRRCSEMGHKMILLTSNEDEEKLAFIRYYCRSFGIRIDYVNENPVVCPGCRKPYYNILIDDRAGMNEACEILNAIIKEQENEATDIKPAAQ